MKTSILSIVAILMTVSGVAKANLADLQRMTTSDFLLGKAKTGCQPKGLKSDSRGEYAYVAEMCGKKIDGVREATVSIFNLKTMLLEKTLITPAGARNGIIGNTEIEFTLDDQYALAARAEGGADSPVYPGYGMVTAIDAKDQTIKEYIPVKGQGSKIIARRPYVQSEGKKQIIYVANYFSDDISVLDVAGLSSDRTLEGDRHYVTKIKLTSAFVNLKKRGYQIAPRGVAFSPDGKYAMVLGSETGSIILVDSVNHKQIAELPPIPDDVGGRPLNVRHVVLSNDGRLAYLSHMRGNAVSRIDFPKLIALALKTRGVIDAEAWKNLLVPFANGKKILVLENYPKDHPNFANKTWDLAHPNTIVLDPVNNRYLYVSSRTTSNVDYNIIDTKIKGKVDIIDVTTGTTIITLVGGAQPTALEVTPDNRMLISGGFKDDTLYFFDLKKILNIYEH